MHINPHNVYQYFQFENFNTIIKKNMKKFKKTLSFYITYSRIVKTYLYLIQTNIYLWQYNNNKFTRMFINLILIKATPITNLLYKNDNDVEKFLNLTYKLELIKNIFYKKHKSYGCFKTTKKNNLKRKIYKKLYIVNYRFM